MSRENAEALARRWISAFDDPDAFRSTLHPDIVWFPFEDNHTPSHGVEAAMRIRDHWLDSWDEMRGDIEEVVGDGDSVVARVHVTAQGKTSGVEVDVRLFVHFKVRDGKIVYVFEHQDRAAALEALRSAE
ncbi:MAG: nuclear transport factor 2 family protein [Solirubrobacteraceae bacterium]|jgi:ketosteroid isomerase-like protein